MANKLLDYVFPYLPNFGKNIIIGYQDIGSALEKRREIHKTHLGVITKGSLEDEEICDIGVYLLTSRNDSKSYRAGSDLFVFSHPKTSLEAKRTHFSFIDDSNSLESLSTE